MAIDIEQFKLPIAPIEARNFIQRNTDEFGVFFDVDRCYELSAILQMENVDMSRKMRRLTNEPKLMLDDKEKVMQVLKKMGVNGIDFYNERTKKICFDANVQGSILTNPNYSEDVRVLVKHYAQYISNKRNKGNIENFAALPKSRALSVDKHRMSIGHPLWSLLNTSRIAAKDPGIQGIPRTMGDIICEPEGYKLIRCDSGQIEPRINFSTYLRDELIMDLIVHYDDAYYGLLNYCKMSAEEERLCREDFAKNYKPLEITDEIADMRQNIKRLTNAGSYGSTNLDGINPGLAKVYEAKIVKHPKRIALERKVTQDVNRGIDTFYGQFGTPVTPDETDKYKKGDTGWKDHVIRCGINNPVQTTASELMMFSVNEARKVILNAKDTHIAFYKHDEACFYVSDEDMANGVGDALMDITAYNVKGWIPIHADPLVGKKHGNYPSYII